MQFNLKPPYNGIAQDRFYWDNGECAYMENISNEQMRYATIEKWFALSSFPWPSTWATWLATFTPNQMLDTPAWLITCGDSKVLFNSWDVSAVVAWAKRIEYKLDNSWWQTNYFITSTGVTTTNSWVTATIWGAATHPWTTSWTVTASCMVYNDILFARWSFICKYDSVTNVITSLSSNIPILTWSTVKYMYFYNDMVYIVTTYAGNTITYQVQYSSWGYGIYGTEKIEWEICTWAVWVWPIIYWTTSNKIYWFSWTSSQLIRFIWVNNSFDEAIFPTSSILVHNKWYIYIGGNGTDIYVFWTKYQWRRQSLRKITYTESIVWMTRSIWNSLYIATDWQSSLLYIRNNSDTYPNSGFYITLPFDGGDYSQVKTNLKFRVGYQLPTWTSIDIGVMTDAMEIASTTTYADLTTISDTTKRVSYIGVQEVLDALGSNTPEWQYLIFKVTLNGGGWSSWARDNTPKFYDITPVYEESENNF